MCQAKLLKTRERAPLNARSESLYTVSREVKPPQVRQRCEIFDARTNLIFGQVEIAQLRQWSKILHSRNGIVRQVKLSERWHKMKIFEKPDFAKVAGSRSLGEVQV